MQNTATRGAGRASRTRSIQPRPGASRHALGRAIDAVRDRAVGILNAVAFLSLAAALLSLVLL